MCEAFECDLQGRGVHMARKAGRSLTGWPSFLTVTNDLRSGK
jgi:hypothetical protein